MKIYSILFGSIVGFLLMISLIEISGRLFPDMLPERTQDALKIVGHQKIGKFIRKQTEYFEGDKTLGIHLKPHVQLFLEHPDFSFWVTTSPLPDNSKIGARDPIPQKKTDGVAVGDSFTFGTGVDAPQTWVRRLERETQKTFVNLGLPSACSTQYTLMLKAHGFQFSPKIVLWEAYMPDIIENTWFDSWQKSGGGSVYNMGLWGDRMKRSGNVSASKRILYWLSTHSVTFNLLKNIARGTGHEYKNKSMDITFGGPYRFDITDPQVNEGWKLMQKAILDADAAAKKNGAKLTVVYFPTKEETYSDLLAKITPVKPIGLGELRSMLSAFLEKEKIDFLDLTPDFRAEANLGKQLYFKYDGHWNAEGQSLVARLIARHLKNHAHAEANQIKSFNVF